MRNNTSWLQHIPKHWEIKRLKDLGFFYGGLSGKSGDDFQSEDENIVKPFIPYTNILNNFYVNPKVVKFVVINDNEDQNKIQQGDLLFLMSSEDYESIAKASVFCENVDEIYLNSFCKGLRITNKDVYSPFLCYVLSNDDCRDAIRLEAQGFTRINIKTGKVASASIPLPPLAEQEKIARYLDEKVGEIDQKVSLIEKKIERYQLLKKSIINKVVTKGLHPEAPLKDSHISWLGQIPAHWEIKRMKDIFLESDELTETGTEDLLSVSEYYGVARRKDKMTEDEVYETRADSLIGYKVCHRGDLVSNIMLTWKRALGISNYDGIVSPAYAVYKGIGINSEYYHYLLRSDMYIAEFKRHSKGIIESRLRLYTDRFYNIPAIYPPLSEQQEIASYLDQKCADIDTIIANCTAQIEKYKTLKRALINEVVTGQRTIE